VVASGTGLYAGYERNDPKLFFELHEDVVGFCFVQFEFHAVLLTFRIDTSPRTDALIVVGRRGKVCPVAIFVF
jgi:hypothetical protein